MRNEPANIYEANGSNFSQETERLASFDLPTRVSIEALGDISPNDRVLDVGAGPNTGLVGYVHSRGAYYVALDKNAAFLERQKQAGAEAVLGDIRSLPLPDDEFNMCHARFVISHLGTDKQKAIAEIIRITKPGGKAILIDYDWATAHGSPAFNRVRNFMLQGGFLFDAGFGAELENQVKAVADDAVTIAVRHSLPVQMADYAQVLKLREAGATDLTLQGKVEAIADWHAVLDGLQNESELDTPPGFFFPGMTVVTVKK